MNPFPGSWPLVRKNLPGLLGAGLYTIGSNYLAGRRAYKALRQDSVRQPFATNTVSRTKMPVSRRPAMRIAKRRMTRRFSKGMSTNMTKRFVRSTSLTGNSLQVTATTAAYTSINASLNNVLTSDLTPVYRLYRIRKVVLHLVPRVDTANSAQVSNYNAFVSAACDPESTAAPANPTQVSAYDNSYQKFVTSGDRFTYTFYPKVTNSVDINGTASAVGSYAANPWLRLDSTGITVPHLSLKLAIQTNAATTLNFDYYFDYHFDVRGIA